MQSRKLAICYGIWALILFGTECVIGTWLNDWHFVRNYVGDVLVIPLIYCVIRIFTYKLPRLMPFLVCCIGFITEITQYFKLYALLGFAPGSLPAIIMGTGFSWYDMICYIVGMLLIYLAEHIVKYISRKTAAHG